MLKNYFFLLNAFIFLTVFPTEAVGARILCVFQAPAPSHHRTLKAIARALSLSGHEVISVTPLPINDPALTNLTEIEITGPRYLDIFVPKFEFFWSKELPIYKRISKILSLMDEISETILDYEPFRKIYQDETQQFDLIVIQTYLSPVMYALSEKMKTPLIAVSSMGLWAGSHFAAGNPNPPAIYSEMYLPYNGDLSFCERIKSTLYFLWTRFYVYFIAMPRADAIARKYLGPDLPYLADIERNASALFFNINPIFYTPRPLVPTTVPLSFLHIRPPKPLPENLKRELDRSKNGAVYFSMGSSVKGVNIPKEVTKVFMQAMAELPYTVFWKFENEQFPGIPENVVVRKWFPQQDVLAHPNIKIFVNQCGLQSFEEAVDREVPMVCIPFISDQELNSRKLATVGIIREIDYLNTTKDELVKTIIDVAENPLYKERMKDLRQLLQDEPMTGVEKAVWWSEYVIRHKGTKHLRSPTADLEWYKFLLLDVFTAIVGGPILVLIVLWKVFGLLLRIFSKKERKVKKH